MRLSQRITIESAHESQAPDGSVIMTFSPHANVYASVVTAKAETSTERKFTVWKTAQMIAVTTTFIIRYGGVRHSISAINLDGGSGHGSVCRYMEFVATTQAPFEIDSEASFSNPQTAVTLAFFGDVGQPVTAQADLASMVNTWQPDAVLDGGDNSYNGSADDWAAFGNFISGGNYLTVRGNHTYDHQQRMDLHSEHFGYLKTGNDWWWKRSYGNGLVEIFGVETGIKTDHATIDGSYLDPNGRQLTWLRSQLLSSTSKHKLVMLHHPPTTTELDVAHSVNLESLADTLKLADGVLCGHVHFAEWLIWHGIPILNASGAVRENGTSRTQPTNGGRPIFIEDSDRLAVKLLVDADDVMVEFFDIPSGNLRYRRSLYDQTPRPYFETFSVIPEGQPLGVADHTVTTATAALKITAINVISGGATAQIFNGTQPMTPVFQTAQLTRVNGNDITRPWVKPGSRISIRIGGGYANASGLLISLQGELLA